MFKVADPKRAKEVAERFLKNKQKLIVRAIEEKVNWTSATLVLEAYWRGQMTGDTGPALAYWKSVASQGIPLPSEPK